MHRLNTLLATGLIAVTFLGAGCVSFNGPNDVRRAISKQENIILDEKMGVTVGPVGVFLANVIGAGYLPINIHGVDWVTYGEYVSRCEEPSAEPFTLRDLELPGWERIVRVCEPGEDILVMVPRNTDELREMLVVMREDDEVRIVTAEGDLEELIGRALEAGLVNDDIVLLVNGDREDINVVQDTTVNPVSAWHHHLLASSMAGLADMSEEDWRACAAQNDSAASP